MRSLAAGGFALSLLTVLAGCGDTTGPDGATTRVSLSVAVPAGAPASSSVAPTFAVTQSDDQGNSLEVTRLALVLSEIELETDEDECPDVEGEQSDGCEELERGPLLVDFEPAEGSIQRDVAVRDLPSSLLGVVFDEVEFEIEPPEEDDGENPDDFLGPGVSVRVDGTFNGEPYTYTSDLEAEQELEENVSVEVMGEENPETNVTLQVDLQSWFRAGDGSLVDPATALEGGENEDVVEENISDSFDAFEDEDEDGEAEDEDDDEDPDGDDDEEDDEDDA